MSEVCIDPAKVVTFFALVSGISCAPLGKAFLLMRDFVDPGSNNTLSKALDFLSPMVSTTMIVMGVRLLSLGVPVLGVGII